MSKFVVALTGSNQIAWTLRNFGVKKGVTEVLVGAFDASPETVVGSD